MMLMTMKPMTIGYKIRPVFACGEFSVTYSRGDYGGDPCCTGFLDDDGMRLWWMETVEIHGTKDTPTIGPNVGR